MIAEVYDLECLSNLFTYTGYCRITKKYFKFVIHKLRNDYNQLITHLFRDKLIMIGFNNDSYDYPLLHHLINHFDEYKNLDGETLSKLLYKKSQQIIDMEFSAIADKNKFIKQLDLFLIWHLNNPARSTSLKDLEIAMRLPNVEDMPIHHTSTITTIEEIETILKYNETDVFATDKFFDITLGYTEHVLYSGKNKIQLRKDIIKKYNVSCLNYNDVKIGEQLLLKLYCNKAKLNPWEVSKLRTIRESIVLKDCILPIYDFKLDCFKALHSWFSDQIITTTNKVFSDLPLNKITQLIPYIHPESVSKATAKKPEVRVSNINIFYKNIRLDYGTGGIHASKTGIFKSTESKSILDIDVGSLYPSIGVQNGFYPAHLGPIFSEVYGDDIVNVRLTEKVKPKKERDFTIMEGFKLAANGSYGKSGEETSFLCDKAYTMKITINGQLLLTMLLENITIAIPNIEILQCNTDGITFLIDRDKEEYCREICAEWEKKTKLVLEYANYDLMVLRDVNNYIAQYTNGELKLKGCFEIDKELHKDPSSRIVAIALKEYFINNIPIETTIRNHKNIYDFCIRLKTKGDYAAEYHCIENGKYTVKPLTKTTRVYISGGGGSLYKRRKLDNALTGFIVGYSTTLFNQYFEKENFDYGINYFYYIAECNKIISAIVNQQLTLF